MNECCRCGCDLGEDWDFWIQISDYSNKVEGRWSFDYPVCKDCWHEIKELLES